MKQERETGHHWTLQIETKNGSKVKESENTLKAKSHKEMFSMSLLERTSATLT